ncbi:MAG TPA: hypothetical protein VJ911_04275 [Cryomorphaceae bacterium]|nr:hypothetical protein [Cryomorphaceae bacterium]
MKTVELRKLYHRDGRRIALIFEKDRELIAACKELDARYSMTHKCWYIDNKRQNLKRIFEVFKGKARVDTTVFFGKPKEVLSKRERMSVSLSEHGNAEPEKFLDQLRSRRLSENNIRSTGQRLKYFSPIIARSA